LNPDASTDSDGRGDLLSFEQAEFTTAYCRLLGKASLGTVGDLFVPSACRQGGWGRHVALHGCRRAARQLGEQFVRFAGYNAWAQRHATDR